MRDMRLRSGSLGKSGGIHSRVMAAEEAGSGVCYEPEIHSMELESQMSGTSSHQELPTVSLESKAPDLAPEFSENGLNVRGLVPEVFNDAGEKLAILISERNAIKSLKTTLLRIKDDSTSCKESLLSEVTSVDHQIYFPAFYSLERAKLLVVSTFDEEIIRLKKLQRNLVRLNSKRISLLQTVSDIPEETEAGLLKEFEKSIRKLLYGVNDFQKTVEHCEASGFDNFELSYNFDSIQLQLQKLSLVCSDVGDIRGQLALLPIESHFSQQENQKSPEVNWDLDPKRIYVKNLPEAMEECDLHAYFSKFGLITEVFRPKHKMGLDTVRCGFITFLETDSVRRVLEVQPHVLGGQHMIVRLTRRKQENAILVTGRADDDLTQSDNGNDSPLASYDPTIFVGHLKQEVTRSHLEAYFSQFSRVSKAIVIRDWATGISCGYGFVTFADCKAFERGVLKACHFLHGCRLSVQLSINRVPSHVDPGRTPFQFGMQLRSDVNPKGIFVCGLPDSTEKREVHEYFSKFGVVTKINLINRMEKFNSHFWGFVNFRDTDTVEKVLEAQPHVINATQITVSYAVSRTSGDTEPHAQANAADEGASTSAPNPMAIFVGRLNLITTAADLQAHFSKFGSVSHAKVATHWLTGLSRGFGFVKFTDKAAFDNGVLEACHNINGSELEVKPAMPESLSRFFGF